MAVLVVLVIGNSAATGGQIIDLDVKAFAGADSVQIGGSFVSTTVTAGSGVTPSSSML